MSDPIQSSEQTTEKFNEYLDGTNKILNDILDIFNLNKVTITFDSKLGTDVSPITYYKGQSYGVLPKPIRPGYDFAGWFKQYYKDIITERETYSEPVLDYDKVDFDANAVLYAKWTNAAIKVVLNPSTGTVYPEEIYVTYLSTFPSLPNPDLPLAKFQYWYGYPETSSIVTEQTVLSTYDELEISAKFNEEYCTLRYNPNGGTGYIPPNKPCRFNEEVSGEELTSINLTKPGYTALGWSQSKNNPDVFLSNDTLEIWTDTEIWAYYEPNHYVVSYLDSEKTQEFIYGEAKELLTFDQAGIAGEEEYKSWAYDNGISTLYYEPGGLVCNLTTEAKTIQLSASTNPPNSKNLVSVYPNCYDPFVWIGELNQKSTNITRKTRKSPKNKKRSKSK